jgi:signal transduction histidine kinase
VPESRRELAVSATLVVVCAVLIGLRPAFSSSPLPAVPMAALCFATGAWLPLRGGAVGMPAVMVALQVAMGFADFPNVEIAIFTVLPWLAGVELRRRRALVTELAARCRELEAAEDAFVRLAVRRERAAIARELHDIVAHHLAVIVVQAGAGRIAGNGSAEAFRAIRAAAEQALTEMALLIDVLESDREQDGFARLPVLLAQAAAGGLEVHLTPPPVDVPIAPELQALAMVVIHESLTNAIKHAPGAVVEVRVVAREDTLEVEIEDAGAAGERTLAATGAGLGLAGLRERVAALRGTLDAGPHADGWRVRASLPRVAGPSAG